MKGIILAGGSGTRLYPATCAVSKQLLPVYDKPMVYYPLTTLVEAGVKDILLISTPKDTPRFETLLGNGKQWGMSLQYATQQLPQGIAQALLIGEEFIGNNSVALVLGDNVFHGSHFDVKHCANDSALIFGYEVSDPERYGVIELGSHNVVTSLEEKPQKPKSKIACTGFYCYGAGASKRAAKLHPSARRELEITDLNNQYLGEGKLQCQLLEKGSVWLDTGTHQSLYDASCYVQTIEARTGKKIGCPEEAAFKNNWITKAQLKNLAGLESRNSYGEYLWRLATDGN